MWPFVKNLFLDETKFVGMFRAGLMGLGAAQLSGVLDLTFLPEAVANVVGIGSLMGAGLLRSSSHKPDGADK